MLIAPPAQKQDDGPRRQESGPGLVEVSLHRLRMEPREPSDDLADMLAEALVRALDGTRKCPRGVNLMVFLARAMKSIAWADRTSAKAQREIGPVEDRPADTDLMEVSTVVGL